MMNISVKMYYDQFKWHFEKASKGQGSGDAACVCAVQRFGVAAPSGTT